MTAKFKYEAHMETDPEYDEDLCINAAQLRAMGVQIPERIPDCAWVPKHAVRFDPAGSSSVGDVITIDMEASFSEPFRWVEATFIFDEVEGGEEV